MFINYLILSISILLPLIPVVIYWKKILKFSKNKKILTGSLIGLYIGVILAQLHINGLLTNWEYLLTKNITVSYTNRFDNLKRKEKSKNTKINNSKIVYGIISQRSLNTAQAEFNMGWPWRRKTYAFIIDFLNQSGAKLFIFDFIFSEKSVYRTAEYPNNKGLYPPEDDDLFFSQAISSIDNTVLGFTLGKPENKTLKDMEKKLSEQKTFIRYAKAFKLPYNNVDKKSIIKQITEKLYMRKYKDDIKHYTVDLVKSKLNSPSISLKKYYTIQPPYKKYIPNAPYIGSVVGVDASEGDIVKTPLIVEYNKKYYPTLPFASYLAIKKTKKVTLEDRYLIVGNSKIPLDKNANLRLKYYGWANKKNSSYDDFNLIDILTLQKKAFYIYDKYIELIGKVDFPVEDLYQNKKKYDKLFNDLKAKMPNSKVFIKNYKLNKYEIRLINADLKNKYVMFAGIAPGLLDLRPTPVNQQEAGAHIHVTALDNLLQEDFLYKWPKLWTAGLILILSVGTGLLTVGYSMLRSIIMWLFITIIVILAGIILYTNFNYVVDILIPIVSVFLVFLFGLILGYIAEQKEKGFIKGAFGQYLSPKVIDILIKDPTKLGLGGQEREITAFFSDVAGFSTISEKLTAEQLVSLLNIYLTDMCNVVAKYHGTVDKFEGDAIISFWGAPLDEEKHAKLACYSSIEMQESLVELRNRWTKEKQHELICNMKMRVGLNTGLAVIGNMGSKTRMDYTMMGDTVNLAARLEGANKFYSTYNMISQSTYNQAKNYIEARELDKIMVVGKKESVVVYELIAKKGQLNPKTADALGIYITAIELYKKQDFTKAISKFKDVLNIIPDDGPSNTYIERCKEYINNPPKNDWDGIYILTSKG